jgi:hypothetical protein
MTSNPRGTGPSAQKNKLKKITIGDGSVRDLVYWMMGGDVTVKRGNKKVSAASIRSEAKSIVPTVLKRARQDRDAKQYGPAYNILTDYKGTYSTGENFANREAPVSTGSVLNRPTPDSPISIGTISNRASPDAAISTGSVYQQSKPPVPMMNVRSQPVQRTDSPVPLINTTKKPRGPRGPLRSDPDMMFNDEVFGAGVGFYMGGPVKKKKKKKRMGYGGKMKKYAKGGGIRKPKYS